MTSFGNCRSRRCSAGERFVIEERAISYAPSLTVLREMRRSGGQNQAEIRLLRHLLALGNPALGKETIERAALALRDEKLDPLPEAEKEVKALGQLYGAPGARSTSARRRVKTASRPRPHRPGFSTSPHTGF